MSGDRPGKEPQAPPTGSQAGPRAPARLEAPGGEWLALLAWTMHGDSVTVTKHGRSKVVSSKPPRKAPLDLAQKILAKDCWPRSQCSHTI